MQVLITLVGKNPHSSMLAALQWRLPYCLLICTETTENVARVLEKQLAQIKTADGQAIQVGVMVWNDPPTLSEAKPRLQQFFEKRQHITHIVFDTTGGNKLMMINAWEAIYRGVVHPDVVHRGVVQGSQEKEKQMQAQLVYLNDAENAFFDVLQGTAIPRMAGVNLDPSHIIEWKHAEAIFTSKAKGSSADFVLPTARSTHPVLQAICTRIGLSQTLLQALVQKQLKLESPKLSITQPNFSHYFTSLAPKVTQGLQLQHTGDKCWMVEPPATPFPAFIDGYAKANGWLEELCLYLCLQALHDAGMRDVDWYWSFKWTYIHNGQSTNDESDLIFVRGARVVVVEAKARTESGGAGDGLQKRVQKSQSFLGFQTRVIFVHPVSSASAVSGLVHSVQGSNTPQQTTIVSDPIKDLGKTLIAGLC